jgi:hypothetical protein
LFPCYDYSHLMSLENNWERLNTLPSSIYFLSKTFFSFTYCILQISYQSYDFMPSKIILHFLSFSYWPSLLTSQAYCLRRFLLMRHVSLNHHFSYCLCWLVTNCIYSRGTIRINNSSCIHLELYHFQKWNTLYINLLYLKIIVKLIFSHFTYLPEWTLPMPEAIVRVNQW